MNSTKDAGMTLLDLVQKYDSTPDLEGKILIGDQIAPLLGDQRDDFEERYCKLIEAQPDHAAPAETVLREMGLAEV